MACTAKPILRSLEYQVDEYVTSDIVDVDVTTHVLAAFADDAEAIAAMDNDDAFIEALRVALERDPTLTDESGTPVSCTLYDSLRPMLLESTGLDEDHPVSDADLWTAWSAAARAGGAAAARVADSREHLRSSISDLVRLMEPAFEGGALVEAAAAVLAMPGGADAFRAALAGYDGDDALGAMRAARALGQG